MKPKLILLSIIFCCCCFGLAQSASATTRYVCNNISTCDANGGSGWSGTPGTQSGCTSKTNPCNTIQQGYASMSSGDTLIIGNGTYTGLSNSTRAGYNAVAYHGGYTGVIPPSGTYNGTTGSFTTIQAETDWNVIIDGENTNVMFSVTGPAVMNSTSWRGMVWKRDPSGMDLGGNGASTLLTWTKFKNCGWEMIGGGSQGAIYPSYASYLLFEDIVIWGDARYAFGPFECDHIVVRRAVIRMDKADGSAGGSTGWPIAAFQMYDTQYSEIQNAIVLDSDDSYFKNYSDEEGMWGTRVPLTRGSNNNYWRGDIGLNVKTNHVSSTTGWASIAISQLGGSSSYFYNMIDWDVSTDLTYNYAIKNSNASAYFDHMTIGSINGNLANSSDSSIANNFTNSILTGISGNSLTGSGISYNEFYGNGSNSAMGSNSKTVNPVYNASTNPTGGLKYLPRIEAGSNLSGQGSGGADIGASVMYRIGTDGTFYGQTGYNTTTSTPLWPYPNEDVIKSLMLTYSSAGGPPAARGFTAYNGKDGIHNTLTSYIWEYLGNQIPDDVYGTSSDTTAPASPTGLSVY